MLLWSTFKADTFFKHAKLQIKCCLLDINELTGFSVLYVIINVTHMSSVRLWSNKICYITIR